MVVERRGVASEGERARDDCSASVPLQESPYGRSSERKERDGSATIAEVFGDPVLSEGRARSPLFFSLSFALALFLSLLPLVAALGDAYARVRLRLPGAERIPESHRGEENRNDDGKRQDDVDDSDGNDDDHVVAWRYMENGGSVVS